MTEDFLTRLFRGNVQPLVAQLLEHESLDRGALEELRSKIDSQLSDEEDA